ncbi:hypothetical protein TNCV_1585671 [Trichonephila clavipes]|nr:hypothetical protein TNCV_1585671 [Trichonephila clavipes]
MYLREKKSYLRQKWIPITKEKQRTLSVLCWDYHLYSKIYVACCQKQNTSLRAQAHQSKSRTETVKTETLEKKLLDIRAEKERKENARGARAGVTF